MLNNSGESGNSSLVTGFSGNAFNFSPLRIMLAVGWSHVDFYYIEVCSFSVPEELWTGIHNIVQQVANKIIPKKKEKQENKMLI